MALLSDDIVVSRGKEEATFYAIPLEMMLNVALLAVHQMTWRGFGPASAFVGSGEWTRTKANGRMNRRPRQASGLCAIVHYQIVEPTLFVTDTEIIRRLGAPRNAARAALHMFDHDRSKGFPQKQTLWGNRRYWPAVRQWFDRSNGLGPARTRE
jgi:hypothetical protein